MCRALGGRVLAVAMLWLCLVPEAIPANATREVKVPAGQTADLNDGRISVIQMPLGGLSSKPIYDDWDIDNFAPVLARYTGYPLEQIYAPPQLMT
jgi:hypothetical protein